MQQTVFFAFKDDPLCFVHVLLNSLDMAEKSLGGGIILEGKAVTLVAAMAEKGHFLNQLYSKAKEQGLFIGACRACSTKLEASQAVESEGIPLIGNMAGHPAMSEYIQQGYAVITF
mgnify:CR=1 FL=1